MKGKYCKKQQSGFIIIIILLYSFVFCLQMSSAPENQTVQ